MNIDDIEHLESFIFDHKDDLERAFGWSIATHIGSGGFGAVYALSNGSVLKATRISNEVETAMYAILTPTPYLPQIYGVNILPKQNQIENLSSNLYFVQREDLPVGLFAKFSKNARRKGDALDYHINVLADKAYSDNKEDYWNWFKQTLAPKYDKADVNRWKKVAKALRWFAKHGLEVTDANLDNWAWRGDQIVLRDLGGVNLFGSKIKSALGIKNKVEQRFNARDFEDYDISDEDLVE